MRCIVLHDGIPVGEVVFQPPAGVAHAHMSPMAAYARVQEVAQAAGMELAGSQRWSPLFGDFAEAFAVRWERGRLALADERGSELGVTNLVLIERVGQPIIIADFRPDLARVEAFLRTLDRDGGGRSRPAA